ncbi:MAG: PAS domain S-box protein [Pseudomonadota bacterium]
MSDTATRDLSTQRTIIYSVVSLGLTFGYLAVNNLSWHSSTQFHTLLETMATLLAFMVGVVALVRYQSRPSNAFLFIGAGFLGTAFLDGYHTVVTSSWLASLAPSLPSSLIPWSWVASRLFLTIMLYVGFLMTQKEKHLGESGQIDARTVYFSTAFFTLACFLFFALIPLPQAYWPSWFHAHRPQEFIAALFFLLALVGYLRDGGWRSHALEHWLVLALIVSVVGQTLFMPASHEVFDLEFDLAHFLKKVSYICVLTGLLFNMLWLYRQADLTPKLQHEISEREKTEKKLLESRNLLEEAQSISHMGNWELDPVTLKAKWSDEISRIMGVEKSDQAGPELLAGLLYPDDRDAVLASLQAALQNQQEHHVEYRIVRPDGEVRWIEREARPIMGENGKLIKLRGVFQDITQRKHDQREIEEREQQVRDLLDSTAEAIVGVDMRGRCTFVNLACVKMLGYQDIDQLIGQNIHRLIHHTKSDGAPYPAQECPMLQTLNQGLCIHRQDEVLWRADGSSFPVEYWSYPFLREGKLVGSVLAFLDITEKNRLNKELDEYRHHLEDLVKSRTAELAEARERAEAANRMKGSFLANMSHEIRTPMNAIIGLTHLLQRSGQTTEQSEQLTKIDMSAGHLLSIINDILDISKIEAGKLTLEQSDFHLDAIFDYIQSLLKESAGQKGIAIEVDPKGVPLWLRGDPTRLRQALLNYASNAVKFTERGHIGLRARIVEEKKSDLLVRFERP